MKNNYTVLEAHMVAPDVASLTLHTPELAGLCRPGQFAHVWCGGGVYSLTRRPLSISMADGETTTFLFQVKGEGTRWLADRRKGDSVDIMAPLGSGCYSLPESGKIIIAAGGIGIAPVLYLAKEAKTKGLDVLFLFGARNSNSVYCIDELQRLGVSLMLFTEDGSAGNQGFVTPALEQALLTEDIKQIYTCGPHAMIKAVAELAKKHNTPLQVSLEERMACGVGACKGCVVPVRQNGCVHYKNVCSDGPVFNAEEVFFDE